MNSPICLRDQSVGDLVMSFVDLLSICTSFPLSRISVTAAAWLNMPPKTEDLDAIPATTVLVLQDWLKLLSGRGVEMRVAMTLASKM